MRRAVLAVFKYLAQTKEAIEELRNESLSNNYISVVVPSRSLYGGEYKEEFAAELTAFPPEKSLAIFDGYLVQSGPVELPNLGEVLAAGPFAGTLLQEKDKGLSGNLANFGVSEDHARRYEQEVRDGKILLIVESDNEKINEIANCLYCYGGREVEKWSRTGFEVRG